NAFVCYDLSAWDGFFHPTQSHASHAHPTRRITRVIPLTSKDIRITFVLIRITLVVIIIRKKCIVLKKNCDAFT
ncbi:MAG: hypothetical protein WCR45_11110, partial [Bacteroidaceae bacterium]